MTAAATFVVKFFSLTEEWVKVYASAPLFYAFASGVCFGLWPYILRRSNLTGTDSSVAFGIIQAAVLFCVGALYWITKEKHVTAAVALCLALGITIFVMYSWRTTTQLNMAFVASILSTFGLVTFARMMQLSTVETLGPHLVTVFAIQVAISVFYHYYTSGEGIGRWQIFGYAAIVLGVVCLHKK